MSNEDLKRTTLLPRFGARMPYNTVVMDMPPEMTVALPAVSSGGVELVSATVSGKRYAGQKIPQATHTTHPIRKLPTSPPSAAPSAAPPPVRSAVNAPSLIQTLVTAGAVESPSAVSKAFPKLAATHVPAANVKSSPIGALCTRMVDAQALPTFHKPGIDPPPPPLLPPPLPPPPIAGAAVPAPLARRESMRKVLVFGGAAIVLGVCLVLPVALNSQASGAQASTVVSPAASHAESQSAAVVANEPRAVAPSAKKSTATEAQAGALLLAGRRVDALALYRELARSTNSTTGIEAMAEVLSQEVPSP